MNPEKDTLSEALRELAANSPQASQNLGANLQQAFARHHARRRLRQRTIVAVGLAACVAISVGLLRTGRQTRTAQTVTPSSQVAKAPLPEQKVAPPEGSKRGVQTIAKSAARPRIHKKEMNKPQSSRIEPSTTVEPGDFVALSTFDPAVPLGESRIVRMDLPGSALQLIGYPVEGQLLDRRIVTDILVGQDGMPYAVRLIQARNVH